MRALHALVRPVSASLPHCTTTFTGRVPIDVARAEVQHRAYVATLRDLGVTVEPLERLDDAPDAVFVEDCAVVLDELAIVSLPGAPARQAEVPSVARALARYRPVASITPPATLEGGDVFAAGRTLYVGRSTRTNADGIDQLSRIAAPLGYDVVPVTVRDCLHLKTAVCPVDAHTLLANPSWVDVSAFTGHEVIPVPPSEPTGANVLPIGDVVIVSAAHRATTALLRSRSWAVRPVEVSELAKAEGGLTCSSIVFSA